MKIHAPLLPCLLGLTTGIRMQGWVGNYWWIILLAAIGITLILWRRNASLTKRIKLAKLNVGIWSAAMFFCAFGATIAAISHPDDIQVPTDRTLTGTIQKATSSAYGQSLLVAVDSAKTAKAIIYTGSDTRFDKGNRIAWFNNLKPIDNSEIFLLPGRRRYLKSQRALWTQTAYNGEIALLSNGNKSLFDKSRDFLSRKLEDSQLSVTTISFLQSLLLGDRHLLTQETRQIFADSGIAHMLSLSGLHIGIIATILTFLFLPLNAFGLWKWKYPLIVVFLWIYAALTGLSAPTVRACIMASFLAVSIFMERRNSAFNAFCAAAILILCVDPQALGEPGFQLSCVCVASLILFGNFFMRSRGWKRKLMSAIGACIVATFGSWALSAWWFEIFPITFLPANLLLLPFLPLYISLGGIFLLLLCLGFHPVWLAVIMEWGCEGAIHICGFLSGLLPPISIALHWVVPVLWLVFIACLAMWIYAQRRKLWIITACVTALAAIIGIAIPAPNESDSGIVIRNQRGRILFTDFKNGEEITITFPPEVHSRIHLHGITIIGIDRPELPSLPTDCDVLILASGWKGSVTPLLQRVKTRLLVVHPSVFPFMLDDIRSEAKRAGVQVHDIRTEGVLPIQEAHL